MHKRNLAILGASAILVIGGTPAAHGQQPSENIESLEVTLGEIPSVHIDNTPVVLEATSSALGEKHFAGMSESDKAVRVTLFEKPVEEVAVEAPVVEDVFDWTTTATDEEVPISEEKLTSEDIQKPSEDMEPNIVTASTQNEVSITWQAHDQIDEYRVYTNGKLAAVTAEPHVQVGNLEPSTKYVFEVEGLSSIDALGGTTKVEKTIPVETLGDIAADKVAPMTYQPYTTAVQYETFIPDAQVNLNFAAATTCGATGVSGITFGGDNRSYRTPGIAAPNDTPDYRTMMFTNINWDNAAPYDVINRKHIQPTKKYKNGVLQETKTASMDQMYFKDVQKGGSYAQVRFDHAAGNPFCKVGNIRYNVVNRIYRSGVVEMVGYRQQAPAHEAYVRFNNSSGGEFWVTMFRLENRNFNCLFEPSCATEQINFSLSR